MRIDDPTCKFFGACNVGQLCSSVLLQYFLRQYAWLRESQRF